MWHVLLVMPIKIIVKCKANMHTYWNAPSEDSRLAYKKLYSKIKRCLCYFISERVKHIKFCQRLYDFSLFGDSQLLTYCTNGMCRLDYVYRYVCVDGMKMVYIPCTKLNWKVRAETQIARFLFPSLICSLEAPCHVQNE